MPRMVKAEKDGIVREFVASAFRNVWSREGWSLVDDDRPTDPAILNLGPDEKLKDYIARRDDLRKQAADQERQLDEQAAREAKAAREERDRAQAAQAAAEAAEAARLRQAAGAGAGGSAPPNA